MMLTMSSLVEDARRLDNAPLPTDDEGRCWFCEEIPSEEGHHGPCPWLALPRIVQALEAAERVAERFPEDEKGRDILGSRFRKCAFCWHADIGGTLHAEDCPWQVLVAALHGDEVMR